MPIIKIKVVSTIAAFEKEIKMQLDYVKNFVPQKKIPISKQNQVILCGAGDSYASAKIVESFSDSRVKAFDPLELVENKTLLRNKMLYVISISGKTISNIRVAKSHNHTIAVTANVNSELARTCKYIINLNLPNTSIQTAGSISFLASTLACLSLVMKLSLGSTKNLFSIASKIAKKTRLYGKVFVLGNYWSYPIAMYCVAKLYETVGIDASYERIEEFFHMGLFSCKKGDTIIIFEKKNKYNQKLVRTLKGYGLRPIRIEPVDNNRFYQTLFFIFVSQFMALFEAKRKRKKDCFFVEKKKLRDVSSSMIY